MPVIKPQTPIINWSNSLTKGLVLALPFSEGAGMRITNLVYPNIVTISGSDVWGKGLFGTTFSFDGSTKFVTITADTRINTSIFTYAAWINPAVSGSNMAIRGDSTGSGTRGPEFRINTSNQLQLLEENVASIGVSTGTITANIWTHVAVTYSSAGVYTFYINGLVSGSGTNLRSFVFGDYLIGTQIGGSPERFNGLIEGFYAWNRALNANEIKEIYINPFQIYRQPDINKYVIMGAATAGGSAIKSINSLAKASVKSVDGLAIASVKSINGLQ